MNTSLSSEEHVDDLNETISDDDNDNDNDDIIHNSVSFEYSDEHNHNYNKGRWTKEEQFRFMEGIVKYKNDWKSIQMNIRTRSSTQVRSHAQKFFLMCKKALLLRKGRMLVEYENKKIINRIFDSVFKRKDYTPSDEFYIYIEKMIFNTDKHKTHKRNNSERSDNDKHLKRNSHTKLNKEDIMIFNITKSHKCNNNEYDHECEVNSNVNAKFKLSERNPFNITFDLNGNDLTNISSDHSCSNMNINRNDDDYVFETYAFQFDMNSNEKEIENESVEYLYKCDVNNS